MLLPLIAITAIAIAATGCVARAVTGAGWRAVAAAIVAKAAFRTTWLGLMDETLAAARTAKTSRTTRTRCMAMCAVAIGLSVPLNVTFLRVPSHMFFGASGVTMTTVWRSMTIETTATVAAVTSVIASAVATTTTWAAAVATRTIIRRAASAQLVLWLQAFDGVHFDALLGVAFNAFQQLRVAI